MIIKVCGMRDADNIRQLDEAGIADWMGFIFYDKSARNVTAIPDYMPRSCKRVGVFVNEPIDSIVQKVHDFGFDLVQLHGHESPSYISALRTLLTHDIQLIKMIQVSSTDDLDKTSQYEGCIDYFLFETKCQGYGGSGQQFDWAILNNYRSTTPFILTGGIGPDDAAKVKSFSHPRCVGIDLNSRFELSPAFKDIVTLKNFIKQLR